MLANLDRVGLKECQGSSGGKDGSRQEFDWEKGMRDDI